MDKGIPSLDFFLATLARLRPEITCTQGCYVLDGGSIGEQALEQWIHARDGDLRQAELAHNHRHIVNSFLSDLEGNWDAADVDYVQLIYTLLVENELKTKFPSVEFDVISEKPKSSGDLDGYIVTFARRAPA